MKRVFLLFPAVLLFLSSDIITVENMSAGFPPVDKLPEIKELPDPFLMFNGRRVRTLKDWEKRREEIKAMLLYYQFGSMPPAPGNMTAKVLRSSSSRRGVELSMGPEKKVKLRLRMYIPKGKGPFPAIVWNVGTYTAKPSYHPIGQALSRGYILVQYNREDLDRDGSLNEPGPAQAAYPGYEWRCLAVWAWGGMRVIDYLFTLPEVDKKKIAVTGHSRGGGTALLLGAFDERVALTVPNAGGVAGAASYRYIRKGFTHHDPKWCFAHPRSDHCHPRAFTFATKEKIFRLPFDGHTIKSLVAPRALVTINGMTDKIMDPLGVQNTNLAAKVVYDWLGAGDKLGWNFRPGGHAQGKEDWAALLDYADLVFFKKKPESGRKFDTLPFPDKKPPFSWKAPPKIK
jgi:fermentation-respiration switch protein FrsA (DUF1100 family)